MLPDDPRFEQLILLNQQLTNTSPTEDGYQELLQRTMDLALELYLQYEDEGLLTISIYQK